MYPSDSVDWPLRASAPGRIPPRGLPENRTRGPSQCGGQAHCGCLEAEARAQRQSSHACAPVRRRVGPPNPLQKTTWCCLRNPAPGARRHPRPVGCTGEMALRWVGKPSGCTPCTGLEGWRPYGGAGGSGRWVPAAPVEGVQTGRSRHSGARLRESGGWRHVAAEQPETGGWLRGQGLGAPSKRRALPEVSWPGRSQARGLCCCVGAGTDGSTH